MNLDNYEQVIKEAIETFVWEFKNYCDKNEIVYYLIEKDEEEWDQKFMKWLEKNPS